MEGFLIIYMYIYIYKEQIKATSSLCFKRKAPLAFILLPVEVYLLNDSAEEETTVLKNYKKWLSCEVSFVGELSLLIL